MSLSAPLNGVSEESQYPRNEARKILQRNQIPLAACKRIVQNLPGYHPRYGRTGGHGNSR
jgi:hypothetical protein